MLEKLLLELGLYDPMDLSFEEISEATNILLHSEENQLDCYCTECGKESVFKFDSRDITTYSMSDDRVGSLNSPTQLIYQCQRDENHKYIFQFAFKDSKIVKIGQYPSIRDIESHTINKYKKVLKGDYTEFSAAIGLYSHGVGIGSFVYLRRIFENLVEEKRIEASESETWDDTKFEGLRMDEKIKLLGNLLPSILVENRQIYSILSKGIHSLSEKECVSLFPNVKLAIELILDEKLYLLEKKEKIKTVNKFVSTTVEKMNT